LPETKNRPSPDHHPTISWPNIIFGDFTYYSSEVVESRVTHHYKFVSVQLSI